MTSIANAFTHSPQSKSGSLANRARTRVEGGMPHAAQLGEGLKWNAKTVPSACTESGAGPRVMFVSRLSTRGGGDGGGGGAGGVGSATSAAPCHAPPALSSPSASRINARAVARSHGCS